MDKFKASCVCGNVELSFSLPVTSVVQCHCQSCRNMQGSDYSSWVVVVNNQFSINCGAEYVSNYEMEQSSKSFCSVCGTAVFAINGKHFIKHKLIPLGIVKNYSTDIKPQIQVYTDNKAAWVELHNNVAIFPRK